MVRPSGCVSLEKNLRKEPVGADNIPSTQTGQERPLSITKASCLSSVITPALGTSEAKCRTVNDTQELRATGSRSEIVGKEIWAECTSVYSEQSQSQKTDALSHRSTGEQSSQTFFSHATTDEILQRMPRECDIETSLLVDSCDNQDKYQADTVNNSSASHKFEVSVSSKTDTKKGFGADLGEKPFSYKPQQDCQNTTRDRISLLGNVLARFSTESKPDDHPRTRRADEDKPAKATNSSQQPNFSTSSPLWQPGGNCSQSRETESVTESRAHSNTKTLEKLHVISPKLRPARNPSEHVLPVLNSQKVLENVKGLLQRRNLYLGNGKESGQSKTCGCINSTEALATHNRCHQETQSNTESKNEVNRPVALIKSEMAVSSSHLGEEEIPDQGSDKNVHKNTVSAKDFDGQNKEGGTDGEMLGKDCLHKVANEHLHVRNVKADSEYVQGTFEETTGTNSVEIGEERRKIYRGPVNSNTTDSENNLRGKRVYEDSTNKGPRGSLSLKAFEKQRKGEWKIHTSGVNNMDHERQRGTSSSKSHVSGEQDSLVSCSCISSKHSLSENDDALMKYLRKPNILGIYATSSTESSESENSQREEEQKPSTTCLSCQNNEGLTRKRKWQSLFSYQETDSEDDSDRTGETKGERAVTRQRGSERRRRNSSRSSIEESAESERRARHSHKKRRKQRKSLTESSGSNENSYNPRKTSKKYCTNRKIRQSSSSSEDSSTDRKCSYDSQDYDGRSEDCYGRVVGKNRQKKSKDCVLKQQRRHRNPEQSTRNSSSSPEQDSKRRKRRKSPKKKAKRGKTNPEFISEDKERMPSQNVSRSESSFQERDEPGHNKYKERYRERGVSRDKSHDTDRGSDREDRTSSRNRDKDRQRERDNLKDVGRDSERDKSRDRNRGTDSNQRDKDKSKDRDRETEKTISRVREKELEREGYNSKDREIKRNRETEIRERENSRDKDRERERDKSNNRDMERTNSREKEREHESRHHSKDKNREIETNSRDGGKERDNSRDKQVERTNYTDRARCRVRDESANEEGKGDRDKGSNSEERKTKTNSKERTRRRSEDGNSDRERKKHRSSDRKIERSNSREREIERTNSKERVRPRSGGDANKTKDENERDRSSDRERKNDKPRNGDRQRQEGNEERRDRSECERRERGADSGNATDRKTVRGKEKNPTIDGERLSNSRKEKQRDASKMDCRSDDHRDKERESKRDYNIINAEEGEEGGSTDEDSEGGITQKSERGRTIRCGKEDTNKEENKDKKNATKRDSKKVKDQENKKDPVSEPSDNANSYHSESSQKRKTVGERERSRTRSLSKGPFLGRNATERCHETRKSSDFQNDPNRRTKSQAWSKWRMVRRLFNAELRPTSHTTRRTETPVLSRRPPLAPTTQPRRKREAELKDKCTEENTKRKRFEEENIMPYQGFVDSQVMSLFGFLTRGCVKSLYECPFFVEKKQGPCREKESRGWFLTEKQWVTCGAKDEDESNEQGAGNLVLVWNAIPAWMGLKKPKSAPEKYIRNPVLLKPVDEVPLNIENAGSHAANCDAAADHTSRSPSPRSPLEFHQPKKKKGKQETGAKHTMLSGLAETRTTYSLTTSLCFHYPDFGIGNTEQPEPLQMCQEFQEDTLKTNYSSEKTLEDSVRLQIPMKEDTPNIEETSKPRENHVDTRFAAVTTASPAEKDNMNVSSVTRADKTIASALKVDSGKLSTVACVNTDYPDMTIAVPLSAELTQVQAGEEICTTPRVDHVKTEYPGVTIATSAATETKFKQVSQGSSSKARVDQGNTELPSKPAAAVPCADANTSPSEKVFSRSRAGHSNTKISGELIGAAVKQQETLCYAYSGNDITSGTEITSGQTSVEMRSRTKPTPPETCASSLSPAQPNVEMSADVPMMNSEHSNPSVIRQAASLASKDVLAKEEAGNRSSSIQEMPASCLNLKITSTGEIASVSPSSALHLGATPVDEVLDVIGTKNAIPATSQLAPSCSSHSIPHANSTTTGSKSGEGFVPSKVTSHNETAKAAKQTAEVKLHTAKIAYDHTTSKTRKPVANSKKIKADGVKTYITRSRSNKTAIDTDSEVSTMIVSQQRRLRSTGVLAQTGSVPLVAKTCAKIEKQSSLKPKHAAATNRDTTGSTLVSTQTSAELNPVTAAVEVSQRPTRPPLDTERRCSNDPRLCVDRNSIYLQNSFRQTLEKKTTTDAVTDPHQPAMPSLLSVPELSGTISSHISTWNATALTGSDMDSHSNADSVARSKTLEAAWKQSTSSTLSSSGTTRRSPNCGKLGTGMSLEKGYPPQRSDMRQGPVQRYENRSSVSAPPYQQHPSSSLTSKRSPVGGGYEMRSSLDKGGQDTNMNAQNAPRRSNEWFGSELRSGVPSALPETATNWKSRAGEVSKSTSNDVTGHNSTRTAGMPVSVPSRQAFTSTTREGCCYTPGELNTRTVENYHIGTVKSVDTETLNSDDTFRHSPPPPPPPPPVYNLRTCWAPSSSEHAREATHRITQTQIYYYQVAEQQFVDSNMSHAQTMSGLSQTNDPSLQWQGITTQRVDPATSQHYHVLTGSAATTSQQYHGLTGSAAADAAWGYPQSKAVRTETYLPPGDCSVPGYYPPYGASQLYPYMGHQRPHMGQGLVERYENRPSVSAPAPYQHPMAPNPHANRFHPGNHYGLNSTPGPYDSVSAGFWR